jgi:hypothetical protein
MTVFYSERDIEEACKRYVDDHKPMLERGGQDAVIARISQYVMPAVIRTLLAEINNGSDPQSVHEAFANVLGTAAATIGEANYEEGHAHEGAHFLTKMMDDVICEIYREGPLSAGVLAQRAIRISAIPGSSDGQH